RTQPLKVGPVQPRRPEGQFRNLENFIFLFVILGFMSSSVKPPSSAKPPSSVKPPQRRVSSNIIINNSSGVCEEIGGDVLGD
ncbi:hypothetical protein LINPERHAP2_LOCUS34522, partial [Linum perenne]